MGPLPKLTDFSYAAHAGSNTFLLDDDGVCFDADEGYRRTPIVQRSDLVAGAQLSGPVIIEEFGSTIPVHPGFDVRVDDFGNLVIAKETAR